jgi:Armadillo/beta-catenin-like repeat
MYDANDVKVVFATIGFRRLLSQEKNPPIQQVIDANLVPKLLSLLQRSNFPKIQVSMQKLTQFMILHLSIFNDIFTIYSIV